MDHVFQTVRGALERAFHELQVVVEKRAELEQVLEDVRLRKKTRENLRQAFPVVVPVRDIVALERLSHNVLHLCDEWIEMTTRQKDALRGRRAVQLDGASVQWELRRQADEVEGLGERADAAELVVMQNTTTLAAWAEKTQCTLLYDTRRQGWHKAQIVAALAGRSSVALVNVTRGGDVFGCYVGAPVLPDVPVEDPAHFIFSLDANGRCQTPQMWRRNTAHAEWAEAFFLSSDRSNWIYRSGSRGSFVVAVPGSDFSACYSISKGYNGIVDTTLTGTTSPATFDMARLFLFQLE